MHMEDIWVVRFANSEISSGTAIYTTVLYLIYTLIVLNTLNPLNAVLMMTPGSCGCQCSSFTSV
jgi:hypothetical protein